MRVAASVCSLTTSLLQACATVKRPPANYMRSPKDHNSQQRCSWDRNSVTAPLVDKSLWSGVPSCSFLDSQLGCLDVLTWLETFRSDCYLNFMSEFCQDRLHVIFFFFSFSFRAVIVHICSPLLICAACSWSSMLDCFLGWQFTWHSPPPPKKGFHRYIIMRETWKFISLLCPVCLC